MKIARISTLNNLLKYKSCHNLSHIDLWKKEEYNSLHKVMEYNLKNYIMKG